MFDTLTIITGIALVMAIYCLFAFRSIVKKAKHMTKFQTYSKSVEGSLMESGVFTEHGIVYDRLTGNVSAQHTRSQLFYESVL